MSERIALEQREQRGDGGGWYAPCGCRFDCWDGKPEPVPYPCGPLERALTGRVAPHVHLCAQHAAKDAGSVGAVQSAIDRAATAFAWMANDPTNNLPMDERRELRDALMEASAFAARPDARLRELLEPFARLADEVDAADTPTADSHVACSIRLGDLIRARRAYRALKDGA